MFTQRTSRLWALILSAAALTAVSAAGVTVVKPVAGSVFRVGDVMRVEFTVDTNANFGNEVFGFSVDSGKTFAILPIVMNGTDTVSAMHHYDWTIPDTLNDVFGSHNIASTVSTGCVFAVKPYPGGGATASGYSGIFTVAAAGSATGTEKKKDGGCGTGAGLAFIPPLCFKLAAKRRKRRAGGNSGS